MSEELNTWHAPCGIYCKMCPGVKAYKCEGCRTKKGQIMDFPVCKTYECVTNRNHEFCYECDDFPCEMIMPIVNFEIFSPNNSKVYNLVMIKKLGLEKWNQIVEKQMKKYYKGKKIRFGGDKLTYDK
ncbi:MAG: DUF3795 domain-containing protein [Candidatus Hodarchaeales archaeon]|jgi:hypothetical protein